MFLGRGVAAGLCVHYGCVDEVAAQERKLSNSPSTSLCRMLCLKKCDWESYIFMSISSLHLSRFVHRSMYLQLLWILSDQRSLVQRPPLPSTPFLRQAA